MAMFRSEQGRPAPGHDTTAVVPGLSGCAVVPESAVRAGAAVLGAVVVLALAACAGPLKPVALPSRSPISAATATPSDPVSSQAAQRKLVIDAFDGFTGALVAAEKSQNVTTARSMLSPYLEANQISGWVAVMANIWAKGEEFYGGITPHVEQVSINGTTATAYACDDNSSAGLKYSATGKVVPGSQGRADQKVYTKFLLTGGHWLVQVDSEQAAPCTV